jgi:hypothetical protein
LTVSLEEIGYSFAIIVTSFTVILISRDEIRNSNKSLEKSENFCLFDNSLMDRISVRARVLFGFLLIVFIISFITEKAQLKIELVYLLGLIVLVGLLEFIKEFNLFNAGVIMRDEQKFFNKVQTTLNNFGVLRSNSYSKGDLNFEIQNALPTLDGILKIHKNIFDILLRIQNQKSDYSIGREIKTFGFSQLVSLAFSKKIITKKQYDALSIFNQARNMLVHKPETISDDRLAEVYLLGLSLIRAMNSEI